MNIELIDKVKSLKSLLVSRAMGGIADDLNYKNLRQELLGIPRVAKQLPQFVLDCRDLADFWDFIKPKFVTYLERRTFLRQEFEAVLFQLEKEDQSPSDSIISSIIEQVGLAQVHETWHKALDRRSIDPDGAVTIARALLESVCKHILDSKCVTYDDAIDLPKLYALTAKHLKLSPSQQTEKVFKQMLGACQTVIEGVGAMRNRHGDAHGKGSSEAKPAHRHAELAVNLSGAMASFLLQTWEADQC